MGLFLFFVSLVLRGGGGAGGGGRIGEGEAEGKMKGGERGWEKRGGDVQACRRLLRRCGDRGLFCRPGGFVLWVSGRYA